MNQQTTRAQSATEILRTAGQTLGERGKQYDPNGKQERSMTAIVAAFNAIYPHNPLTVHMGWQFMSLVKMVRGATKPHADSALDQVAYAALAAEEVANQFVAPESAETMHPDTKRCPDCKTAQAADMETCWQCGYSWAGVQSQELKHLEAKAQSAHKAHMECANRVHELMEHKCSLEAQLASARNSLQISEQAAETQRGKCIAQSSRISELQTLVDNLRSSLAQATKEAPCAHNTDEPKAPRPEYVDPFDTYGDMRSPVHGLVGSADPARGGLAYPLGKPL